MARGGIGTYEFTSLPLVPSLAVGVSQSIGSAACVPGSPLSIGKGWTDLGFTSLRSAPSLARRGPKLGPARQARGTEGTRSDTA